MTDASRFDEMPLAQRHRLIDSKPISALLHNHYHNFFVETFDRKPTDELYKKIQQCWTEAHRYYHDDKHLRTILKHIETKLNPHGDGISFCNAKYYTMLHTAIFHDIVYDPTRKDNEQRSADYWRQVADRDTPLIRDVENIIRKSTYSDELDDLTQMFLQYDISVLLDYENCPGNLHALLEYERNIYREYQHVDFDTYKRERIKFLKAFSIKFDIDESAVVLIEWLQDWKPRVGIYAGSFNPFTIGHLDILRQAEKMFDKVIVAVGINPKKEINPDVVKDLAVLLRHHEVVSFEGALADEVQRQEDLGQDVTMVRGIRNGYDIEHERNLLYPSQRMKPDLKSVMIMCHHEYEMVSSTTAREFTRLGKDSAMVPTTEQIYRLA